MYLKKYCVVCIEEIIVNEHFYIIIHRNVYMLIFIHYVNNNKHIKGVWFTDSPNLFIYTQLFLQSLFTYILINSLEKMK